MSGSTRADWRRLVHHLRGGTIRTGGRLCRYAGGSGGPTAGGLSSGLPLIGAWPLERQQRTLLVLFGAGLLGLFLTAWLAISARAAAPQVAATGQATTQSQRLAKSVSQALVGSLRPSPR
jgi:hypothetical protein